MNHETSIAGSRDRDEERRYRVAVAHWEGRPYEWWPSRPKKHYSRRAKIALALLLGIAGIVTAQVVGPLLLSGNQNLSYVTLVFKSASAPDVVDPTATFGSPDFWNISATVSSSSIPGVFLKVKVLSADGITYMKCSDASTISILEFASSGSYTALGQPGGECALGTNTYVAYGTAAMFKQTVSSTATQYDFYHIWSGVPSTVTFPVKMVLEPNT